MTDSPKPAPGWYPDPLNPTVDRWWDGTQWSEDRRQQASAPALAPPMTPASSVLTPGYADLGVRVLSFLVDFGVLLGILVMARLIDGALGTNGVVGLLAIVLGMAYFHVLHPVWNGGTVGKHVTKMALVDEVTMAPLEPPQAVIRAMVALLSPFLTCGIINIVNLVFLLNDPRRQMVHDKAGRAVVVPLACADPTVPKDWSDWRWY